MKMNFEEPKVVVESFCVEDILTTSGNWMNGIGDGPDETKPFGNLPSIGGNG